MKHSNNIADQKIRWFNAHTEACGYLNGLKEVLPTGSQTFKPFWTTTFCLLEGNPNSPRKTYISATIANPKVVELLTPHTNQINAENSRVFVTARISDMGAVPFVYGDNSARAGELGVNWEAKIISLIALKVGDMTIELKRPTTTDYGVQTHAVSKPLETGVPLFELPLVVKLNKNDPQFEEAKARLKDSGYRWNSQSLAWYLAKVRVSPTDPALSDKHLVLESVGYVFSVNDNAWKMPVVPKQQGSTQSDYRRSKSGAAQDQGHRSV